MTLNAAQTEAVQHHLGPILVLAGAGSGKTRVLTHRISHLISHYKEDPSSIMAVTFTNKAANEMKERLKALVPEAKSVWVGTFHSIALRILRPNAHHLGFTSDFTVLDESDTKAVLRSVCPDMPPESLRSLQSEIDELKNKNISSAKLIATVGPIPQALAYDRYQEALLKANAMDFGDLLMHAVRLLRWNDVVKRHYQEKIRFVLVDEYQDTNRVQYHFIRIMAAHQNLLAVGDDDQSIYAFRGATIENILNFERDYPTAKVVKLEENYRSTENILEAAHSVITHNAARKGKRMRTAAGPGEPITFHAATTEEKEAQFVAEQIVGAEFGSSEIAVFYRTNSQSRALEEKLAEFGIPYTLHGGVRFWDRKEVRDVLSYVKLAANPNDTSAFLRTVNTPSRGIGEKTIREIQATSEAESISLIDAARKVATKNRSVAAYIRVVDHLYATRDSSIHALVNSAMVVSGYLKSLSSSNDPALEARLENLEELLGVATIAETEGSTLSEFLDRSLLTAESDDASGVSLMTLHSAKGLEFEVVFLTGFEEGLLPHSRSQTSEDIEEERRLLYVGITRAKKKLYITRCKRRFGTSGNPMRRVSRFFRELPREIMEER